MTSYSKFTKTTMPVFLLVFSVAIGNVFAAGTPADTEIRNQSTATYLDSNNKPQVSTSNEVVNVVASVFSLEILANITSGSDDPFTGFNTITNHALTQTGAAGNTVYFNYILTNTGNADDTFDLELDWAGVGGGDSINAIDPDEVVVYLDANGNGKVDSGDIKLASATSSGTPTGTTLVSTPIVNPDKKIQLIVAIDTPISATPSDAIYVDIDAQSNGDNTKRDDVSNLNKTTFVQGKGILTATKEANVDSASPGDVITYSINGTNTGNANVFGVARTDIDLDGDGTADADREGILITDDLDFVRLNVTAAYASITGIVDEPVNAKVVYFDDDGGGANPFWTTDPAQADFSTTSDPRIGLFIPDADDANGASGNTTQEAILAPGQSYKLVFGVPVAANLNEQTIENAVAAIYDPDGAGGDAAQTTKSNTALVSVGGDPNSVVTGALIGPYTDPNADDGQFAISNGTLRGSNEHPQVDAQGLTGNSNGAASADDTTAGVRDAGETIVFPLTVQNPLSSTTTDVYNISFTNPDTANYTVLLYKSDGITPLPDTNGDGLPDTGSIDPDGVADIVVKVIINANVDDPDGVVVVITASSTEGANTDTTEIVIEDVNPAGVDIAVNGQLGNDDNATLADATANDDDNATTTAGILPGAVTVFNVDIGNMRPEDQTSPVTTADELTAADDTYGLSFAPVGAASAFTIELYEDSSGDGVLDDNEVVQISDTGTLSAITNVDTIPAGEIFNLIVRVTVPAGTVPGDYFVDVKATSTNKSDESDTMRLMVRVNENPKIEILPDRTATVGPGGTFIFTHFVSNPGNVADTVTITPSGIPAGYTAIFIDCTSGNVVGDNLGAVPTLTTASIAAGDKTAICLKVFVPTNAPVGSLAAITLTADMDNKAGAGTTDTAVDIINVISGALQLTKSNNPAVGTPIAPLAEIEYTTDYVNLGSAAVANVVIFDAIPADTEIKITGISGTTPDGTNRTIAAFPAFFDYSTDGGISWTDGAIPDTGGGFNSNVTNIRFDLGGSTAGVPTPGGPVEAGELGDFVFSVRVK